MDTIQIGGKDYPVRLKYLTFNKINVIYQKYLQLAIQDFRREEGRMPKAEDSITIRNEFFFMALWLVLEKKGFWLWKKPFKNKRAMIKELDKDDVPSLSKYVREKIFKQDDSEDKEPKNVM